MADSANSGQLEWLNFVTPENADVHLRCLKSRTLRRLSLYLDQELEAVDALDVLQDFSGLADLIGFDQLEIQGFEREQYKGKAVLVQWMNKTNPKPTVGNLIKFFYQNGQG